MGSSRFLETRVLRKTSEIIFRLQPMTHRQNSFPGQMNELRVALLDSSHGDSNINSHLTPSLVNRVNSQNEGVPPGMGVDISDPLNFIQEVDSSTFGNDCLPDDIINNVLHSIQSN